MSRIHGAAAEARFGAVIAVPARSEARRIGACLDALIPEVAGADAAVLVLANNCDDDTAARACAFAAAGAPVIVLEVELAAGDAHAGGARRRALQAAAARLRDPEGGVLLTTDADSRVEPGWLAANLRALAAGADAVCGVVAFDGEGAPAFPAARRLEGRYATLQAELTAWLDPQPHDPWPNHLWAWGASLAVRAGLHARVGGVPDRPLAEDRAFVERLEAEDARVRHALDVRVTTSARTDGRAPGGLAHLVRAYAAGEAIACDAALEPIAHAARRAELKAVLRRAWRAGGAGAGLARRLELMSMELDAHLDADTFGRAWQAVESASPVLSVRERLTPDRLPAEAAEAERRLRRLRVPAADPADSALAAAAELW